MGNALSSSADKGPSAVRSVESSKLIVQQPSRMVELGLLLDTLDKVAATGKVSERTGEDRSGDMGGAGTGSGKGDDGASQRDMIIARMPPMEIVRQKLEVHIHGEVRKLRRLARRQARSGKPGDAHALNDLYARIRRLNSLLHELVEASVDLLKRLFIRVFVDNQSVL